MTGKLTDAQREGLLATVPLKRGGKGEDVAGAAAFLASSDGDYVTGQVLSVDGGMAM